MSMMETEKVLCVGLNCIDIIFEVTRLPNEDEDIRCSEQRWHRGGNASNNSTVLALLGAKPSFHGTLAKGPLMGWLKDDFISKGVDLSHVVEVEDCSSPTSSVILNQTTGSRTIFHGPGNLPELTLGDFQSVDLGKFTWVHFESRNYATLVDIMKHARHHSETRPAEESLTISVEIEKSRPNQESLIALADVVFVSKDFAMYKGWNNMEEALNGLASLSKPGATVICAWGEKGASGRLPCGKIVHSPAFPPPVVIDTLGAGDTFYASTIFSLIRGCSLKDAITFGCRVAGAKVGLRGWNGLKDIIQNL